MQISLPAPQTARLWRDRLPLALEIALACLLAVQAARLLWLVVIAPTPFGATPNAVDPPSIPLAGLPDPFHPRAAAIAGDADAAGIVLFGVRSNGNLGAAILSASDGKQRAIMVGDEVAPGIVLESVAADHVVLRTSGQRRRLSFPNTDANSAGAVAVPALPAARPATPAATPAAVDPQRLLADAGLVPRVQDGRTSGYSVVPRGDGAALRQIGLQAGDVVLSVNGQPLTPQRYQALADELAGQQQLTITYQRGGETRTATAEALRP